MSFVMIRSKKENHADPAAAFWSKVERIFGEIPKLIRMVLEFNGFDSLLALKGIRWDDIKEFFGALDESIQSLAELDDSSDIKQKFLYEVAVNHQSLNKFKLKLGHKNLIINLCYELQKTNLEEFNGTNNIVQVPEEPRVHPELVVRKQPDHEYTRDDELIEVKRQKIEQDIITIEEPQMQEVSVTDQTEQNQFVYEAEETEEDEDDGSQHFIEQEYLEDLEGYEGDGTEIVEYQEINQEEQESDEIYVEEQIKTDGENFELYECSVDNTGYESSNSFNIRSGQKSKKPKHMYTSEFLQTQMTQGRIGTPGRRRPKISKLYPDSEEGLLDRWADLVRQSCEVIIPPSLLSHHNLSQIDIIKIHENIWEVRCPMCTKKLRLQLTHEGKYTNYKRSNFERHLRIVHYKQIQQVKLEVSDEEVCSNHGQFDEITRPEDSKVFKIDENYM